MFNVSIQVSRIKLVEDGSIASRVWVYQCDAMFRDKSGHIDRSPCRIISKRELCEGVGGFCVGLASVDGNTLVVRSSNFIETEKFSWTTQPSAIVSGRLLGNWTSKQVKTDLTLFENAISISDRSEISLIAWQARGVEISKCTAIGSSLEIQGRLSIASFLDQDGLNVEYRLTIDEFNAKN